MKKDMKKKGRKNYKYAKGDVIDMADMAGMAGAGAGAGMAEAATEIGAGAVPTIKPPRGPMKRRPTAEEREEGFKGMDLPPSERPKKKKKKKKMMGGGMMKYNKGGKVRGCGVARQGVRKAKMVVMKGS